MLVIVAVATASAAPSVLAAAAAGTVVWLASDYGGYITGAVIDAHGGRR